MRKIILLSLFSFILFSSQAQINWHYDMESAKQTALREGKLLLVDFWAIWCGPCKRMDSDLWESEEMTSLANNFVAFKLDVDNHQALARKYSVSSIPRVAIMTPDGDILWDRTGFSGANEYLSVLKALPADLKDMYVALNNLENEENSENLFQTAVAYQEVAKTIEYNSLSNQFFNASNRYFKKAAKEDDQVIGQLAELNEVLNLALRGASKKALKKLKKIDGLDTEVTKEFANYIRAYCFKCEGLDDKFNSEKKKITDPKLLAALDESN